MLLKTFVRKSKFLLMAELHFREIEEHLEKNTVDKGYVIKLKILGGKLGVTSKNTVKKRIKLYKSGKEAFLIWYIRNKSKSFSYPQELKLEIHEAWKKYKRIFEKYGKDDICFQTFIEEKTQKYRVSGVIYHPKKSYIHESLLEVGETGSLSTKSTKKRAKSRKNHFMLAPRKEKEMLEKTLGSILVKKTEEIIEEIEKTPKSEQRIYAPGERIEQDGWEFKIPIYKGKVLNGTQKVNLTLSIDSYGGYACAATFGIGETNKDHLANISHIFTNIGRPMKMVFDRRSGIHGMGTAQIRDALERCGVEVITTSDPNGKPKVERANRTLENDFIYVFMEKYKIRTIAELNDNSQLFLDEYNKKYNKKLDAEADESLYIAASEYDLRELWVTYKIKAMDNQIMHFRGEKYGFLDSRGSRIYVTPKQYEMRIKHDGTLSIQYCNRTIICSRRYSGLKVQIPNTRALREMVDLMKKEEKILTRKETQELINILDKKIERISALNNQ